MRSLSAVLSVVGAIILLPTPVEAQFSTQAKQGYCYECVGGGGCLDCAYPVGSGHSSCIPYCNGTCSVGGTCGSAYLELELGPDGSVRDEGFGLLALQGLGDRGLLHLVGTIGVSIQPIVVARNCRGMVLARAFTPRQVDQLRAASGQLVL